jgi:hypothetical protein
VIPKEENEKVDFEALLAGSTVKDDLRIVVTGSFESEASAQQLRSMVFGFMKLFGSVFNLAALDRVTVADDYNSALANIERGFPGMKAPTPTSDQFGSGFAMSLPVLREGLPKSHIVFDSRLVRPLVDPTDPLYGLAVHTLCHETAHAYDHLLQNKAFPGLYGTRLSDLRDAVLTELALSAWDEYVASRLSAPWGTDDYCQGYEETLCAMYESAVSVTMSELSSIFGGLFTRASYLVGHLDGIDKELRVESPHLAKLIDETTWLRLLWGEYLAILRGMFEAHGDWTGIEVLQPLKGLFERLLGGGGMGFVKLPTGGYFVEFNRISSL